MINASSYNGYLKRFEKEGIITITPEDDEIWECGFAEYALSKYFFQEGDNGTIIISKEAI